MSTIRNYEKARIQIKVIYIDPNAATTTPVTKYLRLTSRIYTNEIQEMTPYHSLEEWGNGYIEKAPRYEFILTFPVTSPDVRFLRSLHTTKLPFAIQLEDITASKEFQLDGEMYLFCKLNSKELTVETNDLPRVVFGGLALRKSFNIYKPDGTVDLTASSTNEAMQFGSGKPIQVDPFKEWRLTA